MSELAVSIVKTGSTIGFNATSQSVAIPTDSANTNPKYVRVAATAACYVKIGPSGLKAAAGDILVQPADAVVLNTNGYGYIAAIQVSAGGTMQVSPLEDR